MDRGLDFSLSDLIAVAPRTNRYRQKIHDALRSYFRSEGHTVFDRKLKNSAITKGATEKGKIDWSSIYDDLASNDEFSKIVRNREVWQKNLVQNSSKSPPGGDDKYHICLLYWMHLPDHLVWKTAELNRIGNDLCVDIFQMSAAEKVAQQRATKKAIQSSPVGSRPILPQGHENATAESRSSKHGRLRPTYARVLKHSESYQRSRDEFQMAKDALLAPAERSHPSVTSIYGAGGYGKSLLAQELCDDKEIRPSFRGGIYWLQFGSIESSNESAGVVRLDQAIDRMLATQYPEAERPSLNWNYRDSDILILLDVLPEEPLLIIADDLWTGWQAGWLFEVPSHVSILVTTRVQSVARRAGTDIPIKRLSVDASHKLLTHGMENISLDRQARFREVARNLNGWPLLLNLANGVFKQMSGDSYSRIDSALSKYEQFLRDDQIDGWDHPVLGEEEFGKRQKLVGFCIEAGLKAIHPENEPALLRTLAVFPDNMDVPFAVVIDLWKRVASKKVSKSRGSSLLGHFNDFSFFSSFDEVGQSLRLHDEILAYFRVSAGEELLQALHQELLASMQAYCNRGWDTLPHDHKYGWLRLLFHLEKAGRTDEADNIRTDFPWLKAKLAAVGVSELLRSFFPMPNKNDARLVGRAVSLSAAILSARPKALAHQLYGRLGNESDARLKRLSEAARSDPDCWPIPAKPHLSPLGPELLRFVGHSHVVLDANFDPSGLKVVTASPDRSARLWDAQTGMPIGKPLQHSGQVFSAVFDPSGCRVLTTSDDGSAQLWDVETGDSISEPLVHHDGVSSAAFDTVGLRVFTISQDDIMRVWDADTTSSTGVPLEGHRGYVNSAAFDLGNNRVVTASSDGTARLWNAETGMPIGIPFEGHDDDVLSAAFDPTGQKIVTASEDGTARIWDVETGMQIAKLEIGEDRTVYRAAFDTSGRMVVTASDDATAQLWDADTGAQIGQPLAGHEHDVRSAAFSPNGRFVVTASADCTARLWDAQMNTLGQRRSEGHTGSISSVAFDTSGRKIVTVGYGSAMLWDTQTGELIRNLHIELNMMLGAAFELGGHRVITASTRGLIQHWDIAAGTSVGEPLKLFDGYVRKAIFNPSSRRFVTISNDYVARAWTAETSISNCVRLEGHSGFISSAAWDSHSHMIVTASADGTARIWDAETGSQIGSSLKHRERVNCAAFDASGRWIVTASRDHNVQLWDASACTPIGSPLVHDAEVNNVTFAPSGRTLIATTANRTAHLWDIATERSLTVIDLDFSATAVACHNKHVAFGLSSGSLCIFEAKVDF